MTGAHKHCMYCGMNMSSDDAFCSGRCQDTYESQKQRMVKTERVMLVALLLIFVLAVMFNLR